MDEGYPVMPRDETRAPLSTPVPRTNGPSVPVRLRLKLDESRSFLTLPEVVFVEDGLVAFGALFVPPLLELTDSVLVFPFGDTADSVLAPPSDLPETLEPRSSPLRETGPSPLRRRTFRPSRGWTRVRLPPTGLRVNPPPERVILFSPLSESPLSATGAMFFARSWSLRTTVRACEFQG